jgi:hypothetical protein
MEKISQILNSPYNHFNSWINKAIHIGITISLCLFFVYGLNAFNFRAWIRMPEWISFLGALDFIIIGFSVMLGAMIISQLTIHSIFKNKDLKVMHLIIWLVSEIMIISVLMTLVYGNLNGNLLSEWFITLKYITLLIVIPYIFSLLIISSLNNFKTNTTVEPAVLTSHLFHFRDEKDQVKLSIKDVNILYIESTDNYITIHFNDEDSVKKEMVRNTLKSVETEFADKGLMRCHRSFIINVSNIENIKKINRSYQIKIKNIDSFIPVSKSFIPQVQELMSRK